jgi:hypothetical protein
VYKLARDIIKYAAFTYTDVLPYLSDKALKAVGGYQGIRDEYFIVVYDAVQEYLESSRPVTAFSNRMREAMSGAFYDAAYLGYEEASGDAQPDADTLAWLNGRIAEERGNIVDLFARLKQEADPDSIHEAQARADGYSRTLDGIYNEAKMRGSKNKTLEFVGDDGEESCPECSSLKGKRHKISWILANGMIPRPGNDNFTCKGYRCQHFWIDPVSGEKYNFE